MSRSSLVAAALALAACGALFLPACSDASDASADAGAGGACAVVFSDQFDGFRSWTSFAYDGPTEGDGGVHVAGPRIEYLKAPPAHGSTTFPVGSIIVKEVGAGDPANHHVFAMVKRGCDFNAGSANGIPGAAGWEWMELTEAAPNATILWRGVGPPLGEVYGGDPNGCNGCHSACNDNDSVCSPRIRLSGF